MLHLKACGVMSSSLINATASSAARIRHCCGSVALAAVLDEVVDMASATMCRATARKHDTTASVKLGPRRSVASSRRSSWSCAAVVRAT